MDAITSQGWDAMSGRSIRLGWLVVGLSMVLGCATARTPARRVEPTSWGAAVAASEADRAVTRASLESTEESRHDESTAAAIGPEPLTLEGAQALAVQWSPVLAQARAAVDAARGGVEVADSGFWPTIQGNYGYQAFYSDVGFAGVRGRFPVLPLRGLGPGEQDFHITEAQLKWTLFQFGKQLAKHDQGRFKAEVAALQLERTGQTVAYEVTQAFFHVLETRSNVEIAERAVEKAESFRRESADQLQRGVIIQEEHLRVEARLAEVRQGLVDARSEEEVAIAAMNRAIGIDVNTPTKVVDRRESPRMELSLKQCMDLAFSNRREVPVVRLGIEIAESEARIARAEYLPNVSIQTGFSNVTGTGVQNANVAAGGIFVAQELFAGGRRRGQLVAAEAGIRSAMAQAQNVSDGIAYEVNAAFHGVEDARERIDAARAVFEQSRENLLLVTNRYRAGDATPAELVGAMASDTKAEQDYNVAYYLYQQSLARLEFAAGAPLPLLPGSEPTAHAPSPGGEPIPPTGPPGFESPFRPQGSLPSLPPPIDLGRPDTRSVPMLPNPLLPERRPDVIGPPNLSRPSYEEIQPYGNRP